MTMCIASVYIRERGWGHRSNAGDLMWVPKITQGLHLVKSEAVRCAGCRFAANREPMQAWLDFAGYCPMCGVAGKGVVEYQVL